MKKFFLILAILFLVTPSLTFADSYDGPYCFEESFYYDGYDDDPDRIRGTCKPIELTSVVSLDSSLQNDYLLALHGPVDFLCDRGCYTTKYSEIIQPTTTALTFPNQDVVREYNHYGYDFSSGEVRSMGFIYPDTTALLDKKYVLDYLSAIYNRSGIKLDNNKLPQIVLMNRDEMKKVDKDSDGYSYDDLLDLFKGKSDPLYLEKGPIGSKSSPSIYTFNYSDFGKHIYYLKGSLLNYHYLDLDKTKLPSVEIKAVGAGKGEVKYVVPVTSPIKSAKNYWIYTKKDGKVVLAWEKSEYTLDNGATKTDTNTSIIQANSNSSSNDSTNISSPSTTNLPVALPTEQKKGFFSRMLDFILAWFK